MAQQFRVKNIFTENIPEREKNSRISTTVPDQAMSISEIMIRHSRGLSLTQKVPLYHDESELETSDGRNPATMDISEIHAEMQQIAQNIEKTKERLKQKRTEEELERSAKRDQEMREKWLKEMEEEKANKSKNQQQ